MNNPIKFKIELTCTDPKILNINHIQDQIILFINTISSMIESFDIKCESNPDIFSIDVIDPAVEVPYYESLNEELNECQKKFEEIKRNFYEDKHFERYLNSLPKYWNKNEAISVKYIKDYLIKTSSARVRDIVNGCKEQGYKSKSEDPMSSTYMRLKALVDKGKIKKDGKV